MPQTKSILSLFPGLMSGRRLADEGEFQQLLMLLFSTQSGIVAGPIPPGPVLTATYNQIASGVSVTLPPALAGREVYVFNQDNNTDLIVYAATVNPLNGNLPDVIGDNNPSGDVHSGTAAIYASYLTGKWVQLGDILAPTPPP